MGRGTFSRLLSYALVPGWAGVDLFFVLSGFLITNILLSTKKAENYFVAFYARRFLRICPLYYLVLVATLLIATKSHWLASVLPSWPLRRFSFFLYLQNIPYFMSNGPLGTIFGHFWSLAVEEQFYIVWPLLLLLAPERIILKLCGLGVLASLLSRVYLVHLYPNDFRVMMLTTSRLDGLLIGAACAIYIHVHQKPVALRWIGGMFLAGIVVIGYIALFHREELLSTVVYMPTVGVTGFALLSGALVALSQYQFSFINNPLSVGFLRSLGKYSYGMYVYHVTVYLLADKLATKLGLTMPLSPIPALLYMTALIGVTVILAKFSYEFFESRVLSLKRYFEPRYEKPLLESSVGSGRQRDSPVAS